MPMSRTLSVWARYAIILLLAACHSTPPQPSSPSTVPVVMLDSLGEEFPLADRRLEPSPAGSTRWLGCQWVSWTRPATAGEKRKTTSAVGWSAMMSHAPRSTAASASASGGRTRPLVRIAATIVVERDAHKGMVVGAGGERLKRIGSEARQDLEHLLGAKVYLELWVKVRSGWADDEAHLRSYGYE